MVASEEAIVVQTEWPVGLQIASAVKEAELLPLKIILVVVPAPVGVPQELFEASVVRNFPEFPV